MVYQWFKSRDALGVCGPMVKSIPNSTQDILWDFHFSSSLKTTFYDNNTLIHTLLFIATALLTWTKKNILKLKTHIISHVVSLQLSSQAAAEESERLFTDLIQSIEKRRLEVKELIQVQVKAELTLVKELIENLEQELADLRKRDGELEKLSHTDDHIQFIQVKLQTF